MESTPNFGDDGGASCSSMGARRGSEVSSDSTGSDEGLRDLKYEGRGSVRMMTSS